jgi:hypothetical protein
LDQELQAGRRVVLVDVRNPEERRVRVGRRGAAEGLNRHKKEAKGRECRGFGRGQEVQTAAVNTSNGR